MIKYIRTHSGSEDFQQMVAELNADLRIRDGEDYDFYAQFNKIDSIKYVIVAYEHSKPLACGAIKEYDKDTMEVKRIYVNPDYRGKGFASKILRELENWAAELNYQRCLMETGHNQPEAISLYKKSNYKVIPNYGQYQGVENSICFEKKLTE